MQPEESHSPSDMRPHIAGLVAILATAVGIHFLIRRDSPALEDLGHFLSTTGHIAYLIIGFAILTAVGVRDRRWADVLLLPKVMLLESSIVWLQKLIYGYWLTRPSGSTRGFPSGHAAASFALAFLVASKFPRVGIVFYTLAAAISWSRVEINVHWPYQVYVGALTGYLIAMLLSERVHPDSTWQRTAHRYGNALAAMVPVWSIVSTSHEYEGHLALWLSIGLLVAGLLIRIWSRAHIMESQAGGRLFSDTGPYAIVRHPRHIANTLLCCSVVIGSEDIWLIPLATLVCAAAFDAAASWEERSLRRTVGSEYDRYLRTVPRWVPHTLRFPGLRDPYMRLIAATRCELIVLALVIIIFAKELLSTTDR